MMVIDVNHLLRFVMENTKYEIDMSRYWFKFDTEVGFLEKELYEVYEKEYIEHLKHEKLIRSSKPYLLTYTPLIIFPMYHLLYNEFLDNPSLLLYNKLLPNSCLIMGEHIINTTKEDIVTDILNRLHLSFNDYGSFHLFLHNIKNVELKIWKEYYDLLENRILNITINRVGTMFIEPKQNIYEFRYKELEEAREIGYGVIDGE